LVSNCEGFSNPDIVIGQFADQDAYWHFVSGNVDYQQSLKIIKKLTLEF